MTHASVALEAGPDALAQVAASVAKAKTSFYTAMKILPKDRREAMFAIYAFCREVDDIADEPATLAAKRAGLDEWRQELARLYEGGTPVHPTAHALAAPIQRFGLLRPDFEAVIDGMQMDAEADIRAPSTTELDLYCARVASAVGRLSVRAFGPWEAAADEVADHLGRALQLTNILRDVDEDAERGRLYLPRELLEQAGIESDDPARVLHHPGLDVACKALAAEAEARYVAASRAMRRCSRRTMRPARLMGGIYHAILRQLIRRGWSAPRHPVKLSKLAKLAITLRHLF